MSFNINSKYLGYFFLISLFIIYGIIAANSGSYAALAFLAKTVFLIIFALAHLYAFELIKRGWLFLTK